MAPPRLTLGLLPSIFGALIARADTPV